MKKRLTLKRRRKKGMPLKTKLILVTIPVGIVIICFTLVYQVVSSSRQVRVESIPEHKYIEFLKIPSGQGLGNIMGGLLAVHLLGDEFGRIVCISKDSFPEFFAAFEPIHPDIIQFCPQMPDKKAEAFGIINYLKPPDECRLQKELASNQKVVLPIQANTYPRWPYVPPNYFLRFYKPTKQLLEFLPYQESPKTVVHLRAPDGPQDMRMGIDYETFRALGEVLPNNTFVVSNKVQWSHFLEENYGWANGHWKTVFHSAISGGWGGIGDEKTKLHEFGNTEQQSEAFKAQQQMQMFSDWYTLLMAEKVYHTGSDFSISAIHFMGLEHAKECRVIQGMENGKLKLVEEWFATEFSPPMVERSLAKRGTDGELRNCKSGGTRVVPRGALANE